jgi:signal-transduction protein with cAMP-binding, CBS, and nucleotidyltransferase domain
MNRLISHMMTKSVWIANTEDTIEKVEDLLSSHRLSSVPVVDADGAIFGIISAPDLVLFHTQRKNPKAIRAWEICTYKPIEVGPSTSIGEVAVLMLKNKIHHVVVTENKKVQGFVSSLDFVEQYVLQGAAMP